MDPIETEILNRIEKDSIELPIENILDDEISSNNIFNKIKSRKDFDLILSDNDTVLPEVKEILTVAINQYNEKYKIGYEYKDFKTYLRETLTLGDAVKKEEIINSDIVSKAVSYVEVKAIMALCTVIDNMLEKLVEPKYNNDINEISVILVDRIFGWVDKLSYYKDKFKIFDIDKKLTAISDSASSEIESETVSEILNQLKRK